VTVTGQGFPGDALVTVTWSLSSGSSVAKTNASGQFTTTLMVLVPDVLGPRDAVAKAYKASAPFLVVPNSSQPGGDNEQLIYRTEGP
jgi:hypothetical protein